MSGEPAARPASDRHRRSSPPRYAAVVVGVALLARVAGVALADPATSDPIAAELAIRAQVAARTQAQVADKRAELTSLTGRRLRALYKLDRADRLALWFDPAARARRLGRRIAAVRVLARDQAELAILAGEGAAADATVAGLAGVQATAVDPPARRSLRRPVRGAPLAARFGGYREGTVELSRRGVELAVRPGAEVVAPSDGRIRFAGSLRGVGNVVVLDHGDYAVVLLGLAGPNLAVGRTVERGAALGNATGGRLGVEVRLRTGDAIGFPIDPSPLLER